MHMRQLNRTVEGDLPVRAASRRTIIAVVVGSAVFRASGSMLFATEMARARFTQNGHHDLSCPRTDLYS